MIKRLGILIAVFALLSGALAGLFFHLVGQERPAEADSLSFSRREPTNIERITVRNGKGEYAVWYDSENGGYVIGDVPADLADMDRFIQFMVDCASLSVQTRVSGNESAPEAFGLDKPAAEVAVTYDDGEELRLTIGSREEVSGDYYLRVAGKPGVYTYAKEKAETLLAGQDTFLSRLVTPRLTVSSPLSAVRDARFSGKRLPAPIEIRAVMGGDDAVRRDALSFGAATHLVKSAGTHELDQAGGIRVLGSLLGIEAVGIEGYNLSGEEMDAYGFSDPDMLADFVLSGGEGRQRVRLALVQAEGDRFLAAVEGRNVAYLVSRPAFYNVRYEDLIMRYFISPMLVDIRGMTVETPDKTYRIGYARDGANQSAVTLDGKPADTDQFMAFYRLATSAAADGGLREGITPQGEPALVIRYHYKTAEKPDDVLRFFPGTARRMDVEVNGVIELDIRESFVQRMKDACEALENGGKIEEIW